MPNANLRPTQWLAVLTVLLAGVSMAMHVGKVPPAAAQVSADLEMSLVAVGWLLSLFALLGAATGSFVGRLVDRLGQKRTLLFGLSCTVLGSLAGAFAQATPLLLATRALEGIGFVSVVVAAPALIFRECQAKDHRLAFGLWSTWMPVGAAFMMALSPTLLMLFGWRANWLVASALTLAALLLSFLLISPDAALQAQRPRGRLRDLVKLPTPWILAACFCFYSMSFQTVFGFLPSYLVQEQALDPALAARLTALALLLNVVGNLSAGPLIRLGLARWQVIFMAALAMGLCAWGIFADELPLAARYGLCLLFSAMGGLIPAAIFIAAPAFAPTPAHVGTIGGMIVQGLSIGQLAGPPTLAFLVHRVGSWGAAPYFISTLALICLLLALALKRQERLR
ncbi:MAG: MFS transporter [Alphaproteobacteria bacterium]|nr:MFS transporter [Alphaproteobacteria bacterium]